MNKKEKIALLEETFETDTGKLSPDMVLDDLDEYDSLSKLALIVMIEDHFGKKITAKNIRSFVTVQDILDIME